MTLPQTGPLAWERRLIDVFASPVDCAWGPAEGKNCDSSVLVPFFPGPSGPKLLFLRRSSNLRHHAGEICFPGGMREKEDYGPTSTALREAEEETGIMQSLVRPVGIIDPEYAVVSTTRVLPVVAIVEGFDPEDLKLSADEIDGAYFVEVEKFPLTPASRTVNLKGVSHEYPEYPLDNGWLIWGVTARILRRVLARLKGGEP
ncbi:MAG: NUDIX hydrolase [Aminivibrio sp.]|jgi:8-oxo-dGTP pyrophosphatase MutT (NUDIX family)|nr:CoA pyrophosphatase [Synergistaceae bacterium]